jgi:hypothetical protein
MVGRTRDIASSDGIAPTAGIRDDPRPLIIA